MEDLTVAERHYAILEAGVDMFGGNNDKKPVLEAYDMWAAEHGTESAETRFRTSAERILKMFLAPGLYENPYLDLGTSQSIVASEDKVEAGYQAQLDSIVMLKNERNTIKQQPLAAWKNKTVYIPSSTATSFAGPWGGAETTSGPTLSVEVAKQYFKEVRTDTEVKDADGNVVGFEAPDLKGVDLVLVGMRSPDNGTNFNKAGMIENADGTKTFYPLSLQYRPYTADGDNVRQTSIAGDLLDGGGQENRSYYGQTSRIGNEYDLDAVLNAVEAVEDSGKNIPVVVAMKAKNPVVPAEFEDKVNAILTGFSVSDQALIETAIGQHNPQGRLPIAFPKDMDAVEAQQEDVGEDVTPYVDEQDNAYEFGFGLSWKGALS